ncbi:MAG: adenylate kinase [Candidatus Margulisiibacteriota bacterium]
MNLIFLGPPGSGKGTQASMLAKELGLSHISMGDILRQEIKQETEVGKEASSYLKSGLLVPDDVVNKIALKAVERSGKKGFLLDGYPRTKYQAEFLGKNTTIDKVVYIDVPKDEIVKRLSGRMVCRSCGAVYHVKNKAPKKESVCDVCGGELYVRNDDKEETILKRFEVYARETEPLIKYYSDKLVKIDGAAGPEDVFSSIKRSL